MALWLALAVLAALFVSERATETSDGTALYLPETLESQASQARLRELFPKQYRASMAVIVLHRPTGLTMQDFNVRVAGLVDWIHHPVLPPEVPTARAARLRGYLTDAPILSAATQPLLAWRLNSADGKTTLVCVGMPDIFTAQRTQHAVQAIRRYLAEADLGGLRYEVTGDAGFYADYDAAARRSVDRSTLVTIALVIVILLLVYRSPVAMLVPIVTIATAVHLAMRLLHLLAPLGFEAGSVIEMFVVVIVFGSGTDYCLFVIARYKEEAGGTPTGTELGRAMDRAWQGTASAIAASALTTMAGLSLMSLAVFRAFAKAGPSVAIALAVGCLASLTLAPSLYLLAGRAIFWPRRVGGQDRLLSGDLWQRIARVVTRRPGAIAVAVVLVLAAPSVHSLGARNTHNIFDELSEDWSSVRGFEILGSAYAPGMMGPATLLVESDVPLDTGPGAALLSNLARRLGEHPLVAEVIHPGRSPDRDKAAPSALDTVRTALVRRFIESYFFSDDGRAARLEILLREGPYTDASVAAARDLQEIARQTVAASGIAARTMLAGPSSTIADIKDVARRDFHVVSAAVLMVVYVILLLVLRRPVLGLFLIGGTVLSFMAALGMADLVFVGLLGEPGLDWKIKFFLLVLLVAVGVDYNIYVCTRIAQERRRLPLAEAVRTALARTGGIVSACGVIVAGTFASMMVGSLSLVVQLGFALAVGILVDTFLVRPLMVPAVALLLGRVRERCAREHSDG